MSVISLHEVTIVHQNTKERRKLRVTEVYPREIAVRWPLYGVIRFHCRNGKAVEKKHALWAVDEEDLKTIHKELKEQMLNIGPEETPVSGQTNAKPFR